MIFSIKNETGAAVTLGGTSYAVNAYVPIINYISYQGIKYTRNDVDGSNAGRAQNGLMIRDRVAVKGKWEVGIVEAITMTDLQAIMKLAYPQTFHIQTDIPNGINTVFNVYSNNIPVTFCMKKEDGTEYYCGVSIPIVEV